MLLPIHKIKHINSINHEGKIVIVVCDLDGQLFYTVRQEGHEENYDKTILKGWEDWALLPIPDQEPDQSVLVNEAKQFSDKNGQPILRSVYQTKATTAVAPVQMISGIGHLYIFRQQKNGKLAVDRFVLDGMTNKLVPKLQVRFKRSRQRFAPMRKDKSGKEVMDSYDFKDANGYPFLEPSTELSILPYTYDGWFSVVLLPTNLADQFRWHIFIYNNQSQQLELWSVASSENGLFDLRDKGNNPGIVQRKFKLEDGVQIIQGPTATKYDVQVERMTEAGPQLLRDKIRVMLTIPTSKDNMALAINFSIDLNGFLSKIGEAEEQQILNGISKEVLLPINSLDAIKGIGQDKNYGTIEAFSKGDDNEVWVETDPESLPEMGDAVEIKGTKDFNGLHKVVKATKNTVVIEEVVNKVGNEKIKLGRWEEKLDPSESLLFDGQITAYRKMAGNTIRITSPKHGLKKGDELQLIGSEEMDGTFEVLDVNNDAFSINLKWSNSQLVNIRLKSKQRRGIHFDGEGDAVKTPILPLSNPTLDENISRTISAWIYPEDLSKGSQWIAGNENGLLQLLVIDGVVHASFSLNFQRSLENDNITLTDEGVAKTEWTHYAASFDYDKSKKLTRLMLLRDGEVVVSKEVSGIPRPNLPSAIKFDGSYNAVLASEQYAAPENDHLDFTIECWVKTKTGGPVIHQTGNDNELVKSLNIANDGAISFSWGDRKYIKRNTKINDDQWHHIAITGKAKEQALTFFIDGKKQYATLITSQITVQRTIIGKVTDEQGQPLANVAVLIKNSNMGVLTDVDGEYRVQPGGYNILVFSYEGFIPREITIDAGNKINIQLKKIVDKVIAIKGKITDENGKPLSGATITERDAAKRITTNKGGIYKLKIKYGGILEITHAGYKSQNIKVESNDSVNVRLKYVADFFDLSDRYLIGFMPGGHFSTKGFEGALAEIRIWNKAKTLKEIEAQKDVRLGGNELNLERYWNVMEPPVIKEIVEEGRKISFYQYPNKAFTSNSLVCQMPINTAPSPVYKTAKWEENYWFGGIEKSISGIRSFKGKLSNVQIWDRALEVKTIRNNMYLDLKGTENDLAVYYPMGGIMENEVIDFSIHKLHGMVYGDPYYSERSLNRYVLENIPVTSYTNDDLMAISAGAKYEETFEFRLLDAGGNPVDPNDIEGQKAFEFYLWGKESRGADDRIEDGFEVMNELLIPLKEGWYKASCKFSTPENARLLRVFGLKEMEGSWKVMQVRKHRMIFYANSISLAPYSDEVVDLATLSDNDVSFAELNRLEHRETRLLEEIKALKIKINKSSGTTVTESKEYLIEQLEDLNASLTKLHNNPLSYYCLITFQHPSNSHKYLLSIPRNIDSLANETRRYLSLDFLRESDFQNLEKKKWKNQFLWEFQDANATRPFTTLDHNYQLYKYHSKTRMDGTQSYPWILDKTMITEVKTEEMKQGKYNLALKEWRKPGLHKVVTKLLHWEDQEYLYTSLNTLDFVKPSGINSAESDDMQYDRNQTFWWTIEIYSPKQLTSEAKK